MERSWSNHLRKTSGHGATCLQVVIVFVAGQPYQSLRIGRVNQGHLTGRQINVLVVLVTIILVVDRSCKS